MCGIWGYISKEQISKFSKNMAELYQAFLQVQRRGPDRSQFLEVNEFVKMLFGFHRLAIVDTSRRGDQPFVIEREDRTIYCLCNGEIYEHHQLREKYGFECYSNSDCEVIPRIYEREGIERVVEEIKGGEFACAIVDFSHKTNKLTLYCLRDPIGVRPMFIGEDEFGFCFSSDLNGICGVVDHSSVRQMPNGSYLTYSFELDNDKVNTDLHFTEYYSQ